MGHVQVFSVSVVDSGSTVDGVEGRGAGRVRDLGPGAGLAGSSALEGSVVHVCVFACLLGAAARREVRSMRSRNGAAPSGGEGLAFLGLALAPTNVNARKP